MDEWKPSDLTLWLYRHRADMLRTAHERGYDDEAHRLAWHQDDGCGLSDAVGLTHPMNWLTEEEVEAIV